MFIVSIVTDERERDEACIIVGVSDLDAPEVLPDGQCKQGDLEGGDDELEDEQAEVAIDPHQVFPAEGCDVGGGREAGTHSSAALARGGEGGGHEGC